MWLADGFKLGSHGPSGSAKEEGAPLPKMPVRQAGP